LNDLGIFNPEHALQVFQDAINAFTTLVFPVFLPLHAKAHHSGHKGEHNTNWIAYAWDLNAGQ
jgi:hypothetical protein